MKKVMEVYLLVSLFFSGIHAQDKIVDLKYNKSLFNNNAITFNRVVVLDSRIDTLKIGIAQSGAFNKLVIARFGKPASAAVQEYLGNILSDSGSGSKLLLINLRKLTSFEKNYSLKDWGYIDFAADAYLQQNENFYVKILSADTLYVLKAVDVTEALLSKISDVMNNMVYQIVSVDLSAVDSSQLFSFDEVRDARYNRWMQFPVNSSPLHGTGVFKTFEDFRDNKIDSIGYTITQQGNGSYKLYELNKENPSDRGKMAKGIWGINTASGPYIGINNVFVPLEKKNNAFYFVFSFKNFPGKTIPKETHYQITGMSNPMYQYISRESEFYLDMDNGRIVENIILHE